MCPRREGRVLRGMCLRSGRSPGCPPLAQQLPKAGGKCCEFPFRQASPSHPRSPSEWTKRCRETTSVDLISGGRYGSGSPYVDCHLDARFGASALEHHIKPAVFPKYLQEAIRVLSRPSELLIWRFCFWTGGEAEHVLRKAVSLGKGETRLVDVDGDHTRTAIRLCERTGQ